MTESARILPPVVPTRVVARPRLEERLDQASACRLTTVVAEAGFGKSTLLSLWAAERRAAWLTVTSDDVELPSLTRGLVGALRFRVPGLPADVVVAAQGALGPNSDAMEAADACADFLCDALDERLTTDLMLIIDDLHELRNGPASVRLIYALCHHAPSALHLVVSSRMEPPFGIARLVGQGQVAEIGGCDLALSEGEIAELASDPGMAPVIARVTGGWPAAVWLALEALSDAPSGAWERVLEELRGPGGRLFSYLATEVFRRQSARARHLLRTIAPLERVCPDLCAALGIKEAAPMLASLLKRGLFVRLDSTEVGWFVVTEHARRFLLEHAPLDRHSLLTLHRRAADWFEATGRADEALASLATIADHDGTRRLLRKHGAAMLAGGAVDKVLRVGERLPATYRDATIEELVGQARQSAATGRARCDASNASRRPPHRSIRVSPGAWGSSITCAAT